MKSLVRRHIEDITPYKAGKPIEETQRELGLRSIIKLASNENALGVSPKALAALRKELGRINRYPDSAGYYLKEKLAGKLKVKPENIVLGNGSDEIIDTVIKTFVEEDERVLTSEATFLEYSIIARVNKRRVDTVALKNYTYDLDALKKKITARTKVIFIANPNNPTGTYVNRTALEKFIRGLPAGVLLVIDEAYDAFIDVNDFPDSRRFIARDNVLILRTFSKAYGLAGVRIGYALGNSSLTQYMEKVRQPFNVNLLAQAAACASIEDTAFLKRTRSTVLTGKYYLYRELEKLGIPFVPSVANFILIDVRQDGVELFKRMLRKGVIVRDLAQYGLRNFIRVTIGTPTENRTFISALKACLAE